jgi:hypothetical protein
MLIGVQIFSHIFQCEFSSVQTAAIVNPIASL